MTHRLLSVICMLALALGLGCSREQRGEAERAGEGAAGQAERAGEDAAGRAGRAGEDAAGRAGQAVDDMTVTARVKSHLAADEGLRTVTDINVDTEDGVVRLSGTVPTEEAKQMAEKVAARAEGVRSVQNDLRVGESRH
jgi:hyperosmotically inducible protein